MLPINVDGVVWLTTNTTEYYSPLWFLLAIIVMGYATVIFIALGIRISIRENIKIAIPELGIGICFFCLAITLIKYNNACEAKFIPEPESYVVYFTEDTDYKKLYENYNIIDEQDNLITIELKEN